MDRREALQLFATGIALQLAPPDLLAVVREMRSLIGTQTGLRTLSSHQSATVTSIANLIIPRTETPGAADIGVNRFVDLILTEWYLEEERNRFLNGLADVDARSQISFGKKFIECSAVQQSEIMMALGEHMTEDAKAVRFGRRYRGSPPKKARPKNLGLKSFLPATTVAPLRRRRRNISDGRDCIRRNRSRLGDDGGLGCEGIVGEWTENSSTRSWAGDSAG